MHGNWAIKKQIIISIIATMSELKRNVGVLLINLKKKSINWQVIWFIANEEHSTGTS